MPPRRQKGVSLAAGRLLQTVRWPSGAPGSTASRAFCNASSAGERGGCRPWRMRQRISSMRVALKVNRCCFPAISTVEPMKKRSSFTYSRVIFESDRRPSLQAVSDCDGCEGGLARAERGALHFLDRQRERARRLALGGVVCERELARLARLDAERDGSGVRIGEPAQRILERQQPAAADPLLATRWPLVSTVTSAVMLSASAGSTSTSTSRPDE